MQRLLESDRGRIHLKEPSQRNSEASMFEHHLLDPDLCQKKIKLIQIVSFSERGIFRERR